MTRQAYTLMTPRMNIVWKVLEGAKDAGDLNVANACRRLLNADRLGWKKYASAADISLVFAFA